MTDWHDVFISHSNRDESAVRQLSERFKRWGIEHYVDFQDEKLNDLWQNKCNQDMSNHLKNRIKHCHLFLFAFSEKSVSSCWMPWELGLADGIIGRVLLWPLDQNARQASATQEYLSLYPLIDEDDPQSDLNKILDNARREAIPPAPLDRFQDLGEATVRKLPEFHRPEIFAEYVINGPSQATSAWWNGLSGQTTKR